MATSFKVTIPPLPPQWERGQGVRVAGVTASMILTSSHANATLAVSSLITISVP
jgi:hypothetical protein